MLESATSCGADVPNLERDLNPHAALRAGENLTNEILAHAPSAFELTLRLTQHSANEDANWLFCGSLSDFFDCPLCTEIHLTAHA